MQSSLKHDPYRSLSIFLVGILLVVSIVVGGIGVAMVQRLSVAPADVLTEVVKLRKDVKAIEIAGKDAEVLMQVLESSGSAVVGIDAFGRVTMWSVGAEKMFGASRADVIGYGLAHLIPHDMREDHRLKFEAAMNSEHPVQSVVECDAVRSDGEPIRVRINVWAVPKRMGVAVFTRIDNEG